MFEPIPQTLALLSNFIGLGFFLGLFYEPLRILRLLNPLRGSPRRHLLTAAEDVVFLSLSAVVSYAYALQWGNGEFRYYFVLVELLGAVVYFCSIGKIIAVFSNAIIRAMKWVVRQIWRFLFKPLLSLFHKLAKLIRKVFVKNAIIVSKHLKSRRDLLYNNYNAKLNARKAVRAQKTTIKLHKTVQDAQQTSEGTPRHVGHIIKASVKRTADTSVIRHNNISGNVHSGNIMD